MSAILKRLATVALPLAMLGCQAAERAPESRAPAGASQAVALYKSAGSRQCEGGGISAEDARRALSSAGIDVVEAGCGVDGLMRAAVCGGGDGRIVIVKVAPKDAQAARRQGFAPLEELPKAASRPCR